MGRKIVVAGATGNLGGRIIRALVEREAFVTALVRPGTADEKITELEGMGATVATVDMTSASDIATLCTGAECIVSALQGLGDVIVGTQSVLLDAAVAAGVPRFVPSDFSTDFTKVPVGENRNFDLRRQFHERLDAAPITPTAIFNGAFAEILTYNIPLLDFKNKTVGYWDDPDWKIDFTTMDDTAAFTAAAALDSSAPRELRIASFQVSPRDLADFTRDVLHTPFELVRMGSREELSAYNKQERAAHPEGENEVFPRWQQSQYLYSMFVSHHEAVDNGRYEGIAWTPLQDIIRPRSQ